MDHNGGNTRRNALKASVGLSASAALSACATATGMTAAPLADGDFRLKDLAAAKGIVFGTAMGAVQLADPRYIEIVKKDCAEIVPENETKMYVIEAAEAQRHYAPADALAAFARANQIKMRGHTLCWHHPRWLPGWVTAKRFDTVAEAEGLLGNYIHDVAARYHPQIVDWDVVNETIDNVTGEFRQTSLSRAMGEEVIDFCFHKAAEAAPGVPLVYNDYPTYEDASGPHRAGILRLLERLKRNNVPVSVFGIQAHINASSPHRLTEARVTEWRRFLDEVVGMGYNLYVTEFDISDRELPADLAARDSGIASLTKDFLDMMLSYPQLKKVMMWGMMDKASWLQGFSLRPDGLGQRPLPYDKDYQPKSMRNAIADAFRAAPVR